MSHAQSHDNTQDDTLDTLADGEAYLRRTLSLFQGQLKSPVLELGSGSGNVTLALLADGHQVTATDIDAHRLERLRSRSESKGYGAQINTAIMDLERPDTWPGFAEPPQTVLAINVVEHVLRDLDCAKAVFKTLAPGGTFAVLVPAHQELFSNFDRALGHHRRYTKPSLVRLLEEAGFEVRGARYFNLVGALGWLVNCTLLGKTVLPKGQFSLFERLTPLLRIEDRLSLPAGLSVIALGRKPL